MSIEGGVDITGGGFLPRNVGASRRGGQVTSVSGFTCGEFSVTNSGLTLGSGILRSGVRIKADAANAETVFVGFDVDVSQIRGFKLNANEEVFLDVDEMSKVFVKSAGGGETLSYIGS
jgi:hypothetical protein|tara:strand:- start:2377 stop:2730 length:354 start_codon:yes stop_codon:yes gene_type:complete